MSLIQMKDLSDSSPQDATEMQKDFMSTYLYNVKKIFEEGVDPAEVKSTWKCLAEMLNKLDGATLDFKGWQLVWELLIHQARSAQKFSLQQNTNLTNQIFIKVLDIVGFGEDISFIDDRNTIEVPQDNVGTPANCPVEPVAGCSGISNFRKRACLSLDYSEPLDKQSSGETHSSKLVETMVNSVMEKLIVSIKPMVNEMIREALQQHECPICMLPMRNPKQLQCGHTFCTICIEKWLASKRSENRCPLCRVKLLEEAPQAAVQDDEESNDTFPIVLSSASSEESLFNHVL